MARKPPYEELKQRIKELENEVAERKKTEESLKEKTHLINILLDAIPCVALLIRSKTREIVLSNEAGRKAGAVPGTICYESWGQRGGPCPWCLAPKVWETGKPQHMEIETLYITWDAYWHPINEDLYLHYAFDITERRKMTDKTAKEVVDRIRTPIEKAQSVKNQQEDRLSDMEETLKEQ